MFSNKIFTILLFCIYEKYKWNVSSVELHNANHLCTVYKLVNILITFWLFVVIAFRHFPFSCYFVFVFTHSERNRINGNRYKIMIKGFSQIFRRIPKIPPCIQPMFNCSLSLSLSLLFSKAKFFVIYF